MLAVGLQLQQQGADQARQWLLQSTTVAVYDGSSRALGEMQQARHVDILLKLTSAVAPGLLSPFADQLARIAAGTSSAERRRGTWPEFFRSDIGMDVTGRDGSSSSSSADCQRDCTKGAKTVDGLSAALVCMEEALHELWYQSSRGLRALQGNLPAKLGQGFQEWAEALCLCLAGRFHCCNPGCTNLITVSDGFALVRGEGSVCGGCGEAR